MLVLTGRLYLRERRGHSSKTNKDSFAVSAYSAVRANVHTSQRANVIIGGSR